MTDADQEVARAAATVRERLRGLRPEVAIVLGSGLGGLVDAVESPIRIDYGEIPGFPQPTVQGHGGALVAGRIEGRPVLLQSGRFHLYEGHGAETVLRPVRLFAALGISTLLVTNAAGGVDPRHVPPTLMLIADHINLMFRAPLAGPVIGTEERFPDMLDAYDPALREVVRSVALEEGIALAEGVYAAVLGPSYETPAEVRMLGRLGADAIGMSTVPEVVAARALGMRVIGISTITNHAAGVSHAALNHAEVLEAGKAIGQRLETLVRGTLRRLQ